MYQHRRGDLSNELTQSGAFSVSDAATQRLSENVGLICLDNGYDKIESMALNVLTDIMKEYALDIGLSIKQNAEYGYRS